MNLDTIYSYVSYFLIFYYIFYLVISQLVATKITQRLGVEKSKARFAWLPIYRTFVLSKLALNSYKYAAWRLILTIVLFITASVFYFSLVLFFTGLDLFTNSIFFTIIAITSLISLLLIFVLTYILHRKIAKILGLGVIVTILSLFFTPILWFMFLL